MYKLLKFSLLALVLSFALASCSDDATEGPETSELVSQSTQNAVSLLGARNRSGDDTQSDTDDDSYSDDMCFTINFPINVIMPDGITTTVNSEEELDQLLDAFFETANEETEEYPELQFPIEVTKEDGTTVTVNDDEGFCDLLHECWGDDEWDEEDEDGDYDDGDYGDDEEDCFEIAYPFTLVYADGRTITISSEEEEDQLYEEFENEADSTDMDYPELQFPITVTLADSTTQEVSDEAALEALYISCYGEEYEEEEGDCFTVTYPVQIQIPGGDAVTVNNEDEEYTVIAQYFDSNPDAEAYPEYVFPVSVTLTDGTEQSVADQDALEALYDQCRDDKDEDENEDEDND